ncbi:hypothetical protein [Mycolicibacterium neoaurum]|uniref:hypothetical protein n=1 Tax=Mycolicibacterium neoaurum TaxID=1795 RepID=UPI001F4CDA0C|nr:hypothetical protein [Mycolicibacterium neoaurum]
MSEFQKKLTHYREFKNGDWRNNFKYINYDNVQSAVKAILESKTTIRGVWRNGKPLQVPTSNDEKVFRLMVLMDTQYEALEHQRGRSAQ